MKAVDPEVLDALIRGSFDMHVHAGPDAGVPRRQDAIDLALSARDHGMRGLVLKNKTSGTAIAAQLARKVVPEVETIGALTLDRHFGGINPAAVESEARLGAKVVWMPTHDGKAELSYRGAGGGGISIIDGSGRILPDVEDVLAVAARYGLTVCTGHISREEVFALVGRKKEYGVNVVVSHPLTRTVGTYMPIDAQKELADQGAVIEHTFVATMPNHDHIDPKELIEAIRSVGAERCIFSSDFGQYHNPVPAEGFRLGVATLLLNGLSYEEVEMLVRKTPLALMGISR